MKSVRGNRKSDKKINDKNSKKKKKNSKFLKNNEIGKSSSDESDVYFYNDIQRWQNKTKVPIWLKKPKDNESLTTFFQNIIKKKLRVNNKERTYKLQNTYLSECLHNIAIYKNINSTIPIECYAESSLFKNLFHSRNTKGDEAEKVESIEHKTENTNETKIELVDTNSKKTENPVKHINEKQEEELSITDFLKQMKRILTEEQNTKKDLLYEIYNKLIIPGCFFEKNNFCPMFMRLLKFDIYNGCSNKCEKWVHKMEQLINLLDSFIEENDVPKQENNITRNGEEPNHEKKENTFHLPDEQHQEDLKFFKNQTSLYKLAQYCIEKNLITNNEVKSFDTVYIYNDRSDEEKSSKTRKPLVKKKNYIYFNKKFEYSLNREKKKNPSLHFIDNKEELLKKNVKQKEKEKIKDNNIKEKERQSALGSFDDVTQKPVSNGCDVDKNIIQEGKRKFEKGDEKIIIDIDNSSNEGNAQLFENKEKGDRKQIQSDEDQVKKTSRKNSTEFYKVLSEKGKENRIIYSCSDNERIQQKDVIILGTNDYILKKDAKYLDGKGEGRTADTLANMKEVEKNAANENIPYNIKTDLVSAKNRNSEYVIPRLNKIDIDDNSENMNEITFITNLHNEKKNENIGFDDIKYTMKEAKQKELNINDRNINDRNINAKINHQVDAEENKNKYATIKPLNNEHFCKIESTEIDKKLVYESAPDNSKDEISSDVSFKSCKIFENSKFICVSGKEENRKKRVKEELLLLDNTAKKKKESHIDSKNIPIAIISEFSKNNTETIEKTPVCENMKKPHPITSQFSDNKIIVIEDDENDDFQVSCLDSEHHINRNDNQHKEKKSEIKKREENVSIDSEIRGCTKNVEQNNFDKKMKPICNIITIDNNDWKYLYNMEKDRNNTLQEKDIKKVNEEKKLSSNRERKNGNNVMDPLEKLDSKIYNDLFADMGNISLTPKKMAETRKEINENEEISIKNKKELSILNLNIEKTDTFVLKKLMDLFGLKSNNLSKKVLIKELEKIQNYLNEISNKLFQEATVEVEHFSTLKETEQKKVDGKKEVQKHEGEGKGEEEKDNCLLVPDKMLIQKISHEEVVKNSDQEKMFDICIDDWEKNENNVLNNECFEEKNKKRKEQGLEKVQYENFHIIRNKKKKVGQLKEGDTRVSSDDSLYEYDNFLNNDSNKSQDEFINEMESRIKLLEQQSLFKKIEEAILINRDLYNSIHVDREVEYNVLKKHLSDCKVDMKRETLIAYAKENFINLVFKRKKK